MRTTIKTLTLALLSLIAGSAYAQISYYAELATSWDPRKGPDNDQVGSALYTSGTYKFSDQWKAGVELNTELTFRADGENTFDIGHGYLRFPVTRSGLNWLPGWETSFTTRWTAPTTAGAQQAGGWGSVLLRPAFSKEFSNGWSLLMRPQASVALVSRGKQKFVEPGAAQEGNTLFSWAFEFIPSYKITEDMALTLSSSASQSYKGGASGAKGSFGSTNFAYELIADIPVKAGPLAFAASVSNKTSTADFKFFDSQTASYTFYVSTSF